MGRTIILMVLAMPTSSLVANKLGAVISYEALVREYEYWIYV